MGKKEMSLWYSSLNLPTNSIFQKVWDVDPISQQWPQRTIHLMALHCNIVICHCTLYGVTVQLKLYCEMYTLTCTLYCEMYTLAWTLYCEMYTLTYTLYCGI